MAPDTRSAEQKWRLGLLGRVALLVGLLVAVVGLGRLVVPAAVKVPVVARAEPDSATEPLEITIEDKESELVGPPTPRQMRQHQRIALPPETDVRFSLLVVADGIWVIKETGSVFWGCTGLAFEPLSRNYDQPVDREARHDADPADHTTIDFWPGKSDDHAAPVSGHVHSAPSASAPTSRLQAALAAELRTGPRDKIVVLTISAPDNLTFGALWPFEQMARELMRGEGKDGALELQYQDANLLDLADWQIEGHAPPGYQL